MNLETMLENRRHKVRYNLHLCLESQKGNKSKTSQPIHRGKIKSNLYLTLLDIKACKILSIPGITQR